MSERISKVVVEKSLPSERLDVYLRGQFPAVSRACLSRLIEQGHITVNGQAVKPAHAPRAGEEVVVRWPEPRPAEAQPEDIPLIVLYEDSDLLVVDKPAGIVVHPGAGHDEHTLVNALLHHCRGALSGIGGVVRPGIVHRLDKDTTGCLVVAKNDSTHMELARQFAARNTVKVYVALLCGILPRNTGEIRASIARHSGHRKRMAVDTEVGRDALTRYRVLERVGGATLVEAELHTGRTHQIRVHFQYLGYPLLGDPVYGARQTRAFATTTGLFAPRVMLHARQLGFIHPHTGRRLTLEAPLPQDFQDTLNALRSLAGGSEEAEVSRR